MAACRSAGYSLNPIFNIERTKLSLGIPHALRQDDIYDGMHLAKGSLVIPNIWQVFLFSSTSTDQAAH
jgi:hypothetical protein